MEDKAKFTTRIPELDGLRGLSVLAVVLGHYFGEVRHGFHLLAAGWVGVDVFFTLSGFLIGGILLDNRGASNYFSTFYMRRTCRIFPIYFVTIPLVLVYIGAYNSSVAWVDPALPAGTYLTYTQNFFMTYIGSQGNSWLLPTWSLAVEEQFYILLPLIVFFASPKALFRISLILIVVAPILRTSMLLVGGAHEIGAYVLLPCRWDLLFLGVLAALIWRDQRLWTLVRTRDALPLKVTALGCGWVVVALMSAERVLDVSLLHPVGLLFLGICTASYILLIVSDAYNGTILKSRGLRFFGSISYGLYLIHQPVAGLLHGLLLGTRPDTANATQTLVTVAALIISVVLAWLSWKFFESRIVQFGHQWRYASKEPVSDPPRLVEQSAGGSAEHQPAYSGQAQR